MNFLQPFLKSKIRNLVFLLIVLSEISLAEPLNNFNLKCFTSNDGLPQDSVTDIAFANNGQLIAATFSGTRAFNGQNFTTYIPEADSEFPQVEAYIIKTNSTGAILIGSTTNGLYQITKNHVQHWDKTSGLQNNNIEKIITIKNQTYIKNGDFIFLIDNNTPHALVNIKPPKDLNTNNFNLFAIDNTPVVSTNKNIWQLINNQWARLNINYNGQNISGITYGLKNDDSGFFLESKNYLYLVKNGVAEIFLDDFREDKSIIINLIMLDNNNDLWATTENHGLIRYSKTYGIESLSPTKGHRTVSVTQDSDGVIWFGGSDGLCFLKENTIRNIGKQQGLTKENIYYLSVDKDDIVYALNQDSQKGFYSLSNDTIYLNSIADDQLDNDETIYALAHDGNDIWISTEKRIAKIVGNALETLYLPNKKSRAILAKDDILWFVDKDYLVSYDIQKLKFNKTLISKNSEIYAMDYAINGDILLAEKNGAYRLSNNTIKNIEMPLDYTSCIHEFKEGEIWICGEGLWLNKNGHHFYFDENQGLTHGHVHDVIEDDFGNIWVITNAGLFQILRSDIDKLMETPVINEDRHLFTRFTEKDGMKSSEFNGSAYSAVKTSDGKLWLASQKGIVVVNPAFKDVQESKKLTPIIEHMYIGNDRIPQNSWTNIQPNPQTIHLHFSSVLLSGTRNISYRYKLDNFHNDWHEGSVLDIVNLKPNKYTLHLQVKLNNNEWSKELTADLQVLPAWYQTLLFRLITLILIAIGVFGLPLWRIQWLKKNSKKLTKLVALQTKSLTDSNQKLEKLAHYDQLTNIPNRREFFNQFKNIPDHTRGIHLALIDVDDFKAYNDFYGHIQGDDCLKQIAQALDNFTSSDCLVARFGGEEFVMFFTGISFEQAQQQCQKLINDIDKLEIPHQKSSVKSTISLSIGLTTYKTDESVEKFVDRSDTAMYQAKKTGKNQLMIRL